MAHGLTQQWWRIIAHALLDGGLEGLLDPLYGIHR
jgi:hypothetical protein